MSRPLGWKETNSPQPESRPVAAEGGEGLLPRPLLCVPTCPSVPPPVMITGFPVLPLTVHLNQFFCRSGDSILTCLTQEAWASDLPAAPHHPAGFQKCSWGSSHHGTAETNLTSVHEDSSSIPGLAQWLRIRRCLELWCRSQTCSDPGLLWLGCGPAAIAPIRPLAWESPYAAGMALKSKSKIK